MEGIYVPRTSNAKWDGKREGYIWHTRLSCNKSLATPMVHILPIEMQNHNNTSNVETHSKSPPTFSQIAVVASKLPVANNFPEGDQQQDLTVLVCVSSKTACKFQLKIIAQSVLLQSTKFGNKSLACV